MPPPQTSASRPSCRRSANAPSLWPTSKLMYWAACSRAMSIVLALMFIPMVAVPLGFTDLIIAMLAGVTMSVMWDLFTVIHRIVVQHCVAWPLLVTFDLIIVPTTLLVFGASAFIDGLGPQIRHPDEHKRAIMALVLFTLVSLFHLCSFICDLKIASGQRKPVLTTPTRRHRCSTPQRTITGQQCPITSTRQPTATDDVEDICPVTRPEDALLKQRADERSRRLSDVGRVESLPLYNLVDPSGTVPPYNASPTK